MPRPTFRPGLLALAIALAVPAPFLHAAPAEQASVRDYRIAAGPLAGTLNRIAAQAGLVLTLDPALAEGRSAHAVQGRFDAPGALREALKGSLAWWKMPAAPTACARCRKTPCRCRR